MGKQVILAVAGAGKTYTLCNSLNIEQSNLILAFTNENIHNIKNEITKTFGKIPINTKVMTFHSFIYRFIVCPYEPTIKNYFGIENFHREGICFTDPPCPRFIKGGKSIPNKKYYKKDNFNHYVYQNRYYCGLMTELLNQVNNKANKLLLRSIKNLENFFDNIYIDEFQDFRQYDYDLLMTISKSTKNITLYGDYYQHSVSGKNNTGKPFKKGKINISYNDYIDLLKKAKISVDTEKLNSSRRCPNNICEFIYKRLNINIKSLNNNEGTVNFVSNIDHIKKILENDNIVKLMFSKSNEYKFNAINWGYSKGNTYPNICVILTETYSNIDSDDFSIDPTSISTNKLYVALSRTKGNIYLIKKKDFDIVKNDYII